MDKNQYLIDLSDSERTDLGHKDFGAQSHEQRVFSAIRTLESDVNNGGFDSFFSFEDPALVAFTPIALREIGALACADIVDKAINSVTGKVLDDAIEQLDNLDSEFCAYPDDLMELLYSCAAARPDVFGKSLEPNAS